MYKVRGDHFVQPNLGLLEYVSGGDFYKELLIKSMNLFDQLTISLPTDIENPDDVTRIFNKCLNERSGTIKFPGNKNELAKLDKYLKGLNKEYRQWNFMSMMETCYTDAVLDDMKPLLEIYEFCKLQGDSSWDVLREHAVETFREELVRMFDAKCRPALELFRTAHKGKVSGLELAIKVYNPGYGQGSLFLSFTFLIKMKG